MTAQSISLLLSRRFLPIFLTQFLGSFNDNLLKSALVVLITYFPEATAGYPISAATLITICPALLVIPFFVFSALAGQLSDKYEKSQLARRLKLLEIFLMLMAALGFYWHSVPLLMAVLFFTGMQAALFGPLKYSILPDHLTEQELVTGNGLVAGATFISILLGMILGGLLILAGPLGWAWTSLTVVLTALLGYLASLRIPLAPPPAPDLTVTLRFFSESVRIIRNAFREREVALSILGISWFMMVGSVFLTQFPNYTQQILQGDNKVLTLFFALFSIGIAIGATICSRLLKGEISPRLAPVAAAMMAFFIAAFVWESFQVDSAHLLVRDGDPDYVSLSMFLDNTDNYSLIFTLMMIAAAGGVFSVPFYAIMQARCEHGCRSRVIAASNIVDSLFMTAAAVISSLMIAQGVHVLDLFGFLAALNLLVAFYAWAQLRSAREAG